jgi:excisionase family DNA binding protein
MESEDGLLSVTQAATELGIHPDSLRQAIVQGRLAAQKIGHAWIVRRADLDAYRLRRPNSQRKPGRASLPTPSPPETSSYSAPGRSS